MSEAESDDARQLWLLEERATRKRMTVEALAGALLGAAGAVPGFIQVVNSGFCNPLEKQCDSGSFGRLVKGMGVGALGFSAGAMLGVFLGGSLMGGEGGLLPAVWGTVVGELLGVVFAVVSVPITLLIGSYLAFVTDSGAILTGTITIAMPVVAAAILVAAPLVGGIGFYEGTHRKAVERKRAASAGVQVLPIVGVSPQGGFVAGLAARF